MVPELTFGEQVTIPALYGQRCVTGLGLRNSFYFRLRTAGADQSQGGNSSKAWAM